MLFGLRIASVTVFLIRFSFPYYSRVFLAVFALAWSSAVMASDAGFRPVRTLTTVSTDRSTIDVEVDATFGPGPESRFIEPRQSLRLRLERAYVIAIDWVKSPANSRVVIAFDTVTGLAANLFEVPTEQVASPKDDIKQLPHSEAIRRTLILYIDGAGTADALKRQSEKLNSCLGSRVSDTLYSIDESISTYCRLQTGSRRPGYIANYRQACYCTSAVPVERSAAEYISRSTPSLPESRFTSIG